VIQLLYGSGLRLSEALNLRVKDLDFSQHQIIVRDAKGMKDRVTMLPSSLVEPLQEHLHRMKRLHQQNLEQGYGAVWLPFALDCKYPNANRQWIWQLVFPSSRRSLDPRTGNRCRYHLHESGLQKALKHTTWKVTNRGKLNPFCPSSPVGARCMRPNAMCPGSDCQ
jgi:integrase